MDTQIEAHAEFHLVNTNSISVQDNNCYPSGAIKCLSVDYSRRQQENAEEVV